jgi:hypothetical protein
LRGVGTMSISLPTSRGRSVAGATLYHSEEFGGVRSKPRREMVTKMWQVALREMSSSRSRGQPRWDAVGGCAKRGSQALGIAGRTVLGAGGYRGLKVAVIEARSKDGLVLAHAHAGLRTRISEGKKNRQRCDSVVFDRCREEEQRGGRLCWWLKKMVALGNGRCLPV